MWFETTPRPLRHVRFALRVLQHRRQFTSAVLATLAAAIGASTAGFAVIHAVLLRPLPVVDQDHLVVLSAEDHSQLGATLGMPNGILWSLTGEAQSFTEIAGIPANSGVAPPAPALDGDRPISIASTPVTGNLFHVLGIIPALGRNLEASDDEDKSGTVGVLSNAVWRREFGARRDIIGRTVRLSQGDYTIVGVAPEGFDFPHGTDLWISFPQLVRRYGELEELGANGGYWRAVARVRDGASETRVRSEFANILLAAKFPQLGDSASRNAVVNSFTNEILGNLRLPLILLLIAVMLVLVMACINVSGLVLTNGISRSGELALRTALGAERSDLVLQIMIENAILGVAGGILGAATAWAIVRIVRATAPLGLPRFDELQIDPTSLGIAALLTMCSVFLFGLVPAFSSAGKALSGAVHGASRNLTADRSAARVRSLIVSAQVALAVVLLAVTGLLGVTLAHLQGIDLGFNPNKLLYVLVERRESDVGDDVRMSRQRHSAVMYGVLDRLVTMPGVRGATVTHVIPFSRVAAASGQDLHFSVQGGGISDALHSPVVSFDIASESYFKVFGIRLLRGRNFNSEDGSGGPRVAIVNESFARLAWPGSDAMGRLFRVVTPEGVSGAWRTVVGIAGDTRYRDLGTPRPSVYIPTLQSAPGAIIAIRTSSDPLSVLPSVRRLVSEIDNSYAVGEAYTGNAMLTEALALPNFMTTVLTVLSFVALLLAALGLFGVLSLIVRQRSRELAIRSALGANAAHLRSLVLRQALTVTGSGIAIGLLLALSAGDAIRSQLFGVSFFDPTTLAGVVIVLAVIAFLASYFPARDAFRIDPLLAIKGD